jgi:hypothetical protein
MSENRRATFSKTVIENGGPPHTVYSFSLEKIHWITGAVASIAAVLVALIVLRGAVYASVQDVAADEFRRQLDNFHAEAQPAIRLLIDERIRASQIEQASACQKLRYEEEREEASELAKIAESLARLDERLAAIEKRLDYAATGGTP